MNNSCSKPNKSHAVRNPYLKEVSESDGARIILSDAITASGQYCGQPSFDCHVVPMWRLEKYNDLAKKHGLSSPGDDTYFSPLIELTRRYALYLIGDSNWTNFVTVRYVLLEHKIGSYGVAGMEEVLSGQKAHVSNRPDYIQQLIELLIDEKLKSGYRKSMSFEMLVFFANGLEHQHKLLTEDSDDDEYNSVR